MPSSQQLMIVAAVALLIAGLATGYIAVFHIGGSMPPSQTEQQTNNQQQPASQQSSSQPLVLENQQQKSGYWSQTKQKIKNGWNRFVDVMEHNDKAVVAISTMVIALFTVFLVVATASLFISSERVAEAGKKSAEIAEGTLIATNRPWVSILAVGSGSALTWEERGARLTIQITVKNVGKSPAFDMAVEAHQFVLGAKTGDLGSEVKKYCAEVRKRQIARAAGGHKGEVLFPDDVLRSSFGLLFPRDEVDLAVKKNGMSFFSPVAVVCVDYRSEVTKSSHATGLAFLLLRPGPTLGAPPLMLIPDQTLNPDAFGIVRAPFGSLAD
jgi:hypothetical protein